MPSRQVEQTFGLMIAFVFPGLIGLYAIGLHAPLIQSWFGYVAAPAGAAGGGSFRSPTAVEFLLLIVASAGVGVFLSGIRWAIFEQILKGLFPRTEVARQGRHNDELEQSLQGVIMQLYRYYQFYANTSVAVLCAYVAWIAKTWGENGSAVGLGAILMVSVVALGFFAHDAWVKDQEARQQLYANGDPSSD